MCNRNIGNKINWRDRLHSIIYGKEVFTMPWKEMKIHKCKNILTKFGKKIRIHRKGVQE